MCLLRRRDRGAPQDGHARGRRVAPYRGSADPGTIGFHVSALYSPVGWMSWENIARLWEAASTDEAKRSFKNSVLGETWVETGEAPDWQRLYERRESWQIGTVPRGGLFLTAGADVQRDRIEVDVWAWGRGRESWLVDHVVVEGGPERAETWEALGALLDRTWLHDHGTRIGIAKLAIDTGYEAPAVYAWARKVGHAQVAPIKGVEGFNRAAPVAGPSTSPKAARSCAAEPGSGLSRLRPSRARHTASYGCRRRPTRTLPRARVTQPATCICRAGLKRNG
jgi:phage terminase large subunit GpA-like protein